VAEFYMKVGLMMSSCELFERLNMLEECIACLAGAGHRAEALKRAEALVIREETPLLDCLLGDLKADF